MKRDRKGLGRYVIPSVLIILLAATIWLGEQITENVLYLGQESEEDRITGEVQEKDTVTEKEVRKVITASYEPSPEDISEEEYWDSMELLAACVEAEAGNQTLEGRRMVVDVILNRVDRSEYPDTIPEVIGQPYRFSSYWDGNMDSIMEPSEETIRAVQMELEERSYPGLIYFKEGGYSEHGTPWKQVGDHYFSTD